MCLSSGDQLTPSSFTQEFSKRLAGFCFPSVIASGITIAKYELRSGMRTIERKVDLEAESVAVARDNVLIQVSPIHLVACWTHPTVSLSGRTSMNNHHRVSFKMASGVRHSVVRAADQFIINELESGHGKILPRDGHRRPVQLVLLRSVRSRRL